MYDVHLCGIFARQEFVRKLQVSHLERLKLPPHQVKLYLAANREFWVRAPEEKSLLIGARKIAGNRPLRILNYPRFLLLGIRVILKIQRRPWRLFLLLSQIVKESYRRLVNFNYDCSVHMRKSRDSLPQALEVLNVGVRACCKPRQFK